MKRKIYLVSAVMLLLAIGVGLAACTESKPTAKSGGKGGGELVIYSGRKDRFIKPIVKEFEKKTGIKVKLLAGDGSQLANQLIEEKSNPRADVYISKDAGTLGFLVEKDMLKRYVSKATERVPDSMKDRNGMWVGAAARARIIMYNTNLLKESEVPKTLEGLTDSKWKGKFGTANSSNESMTGQISAMRQLKGDKYTEKWIEGIMANKPVVASSHDPIRDAVADGELPMGLVNHYYYAKKKAEGFPVGVVYPDQDDFGTFINVSGVAIVKGAKNEANAKTFIDFVLTDKIQEIFAGVNREMPVIRSIKTDETAKPLGTFKVPDVKLDELGEQLDSTLEMMERHGL